MASMPDFSAILSGLASNGMSQADLARRLQIAPSTVWRIANGEIRQPSYATGSRILSLQHKSLNSFVRISNRDGGK